MQKEVFYTHVDIDMYKAGKQAERLGWFLKLFINLICIQCQCTFIASALAACLTIGHCLPGYLPSNASAICIEFTPCPWAFIDIILSELISTS